MADSIPKKYKACIYDEPGKVSTKVVELDMPEPGPGEVLINLYEPHLQAPISIALPSHHSLSLSTP